MAWIEERNIGRAQWFVIRRWEQRKVGRWLTVFVKVSRFIRRQDWHMIDEADGVARLEAQYFG